MHGLCCWWCLFVHAAEGVGDDNGDGDNDSDNSSSSSSGCIDGTSQKSENRTVVLGGHLLEDCGIDCRCRLREILVM